MQEPRSLLPNNDIKDSVRLMPAPAVTPCQAFLTRWLTFIA